MKKILCGVFFFACAFLALCCRGNEKSPNVLLVSIDTLRADHLNCYGYTVRPTSPNIDRLAAEGALFLNAFSHASETRPSMASILTSKLPVQFSKSLSLQSVYLYGSYDTLAERLKRNGYYTAAVVTNPWLSQEMGFGRGFDEYKYGFDMTAAEVRMTAKRLLREVKNRRFFLWLHFMDPHADYVRHTRYERYYDPAYDGRFLNAFSDGDANRFKDPAEVLSQADLRHIQALYDGEIFTADEAVGRLMDTLSDLGLRKKTIVVLVSDHGEEFKEHGGTGHDHTLFDELLHVPLIVSWPGRIEPGLRITRTVRCVDIFPTVLKLAGFDPGIDLEGDDLFSVQGEEKERVVMSYAGFHHIACRSGRYKFIQQLAPYRDWDKGFVPFRLYDLKEDPGELKNVYESRPEVASRLWSQLGPYRIVGKTVSSLESIRLPSERIEELKSLGYIN
jgi:arylsulfatase A-like enzyme